jgi:2-succinyl-6-hydroxy-2,4-cyclohexadiene-1-carboxylate synthase
MSTSPPPLASAFDYTVNLLEDALPASDAKDTLVGYSLGGRIALAWAAKYPNRFSKLILISTSFGLNTEEDKQSRIMWDSLKAELLRKKGVERFMKEEWYSMPLFKDFSNSERFTSIINSRLSHSSHYLADALEAFSPGRQESVMPKLASLPPITYIYGENDTKYADIAKHLESVDTVTTHGIPNAGHVTHLEKPSEVARILNATLH